MIILPAHLLHLKSGLTGHLKRIYKKGKDDDEEDDDDEHRDDDDDDDDDELT